MYKGCDVPVKRAANEIHQVIMECTDVSIGETCFQIKSRLIRLDEISSNLFKHLITESNICQFSIVLCSFLTKYTKIFYISMTNLPRRLYKFISKNSETKEISFHESRWIEKNHTNNNHRHPFFG